MKKKEYLLLFLIFLLVIITQVININRLGGNLVSYDPWYHKAITDYTIKEQNIISTIPDSAIESKVMYTTLLYPLSATISLITDIPTLDTYRIMGTIILIFLGLIIFIISKRLTPIKYISYLVLILFFCINYLLTRTSMNLPENYAILFLGIFLFLFIIKTRIEIFILFFVAYAFYHLRSLIILIILIAIYLLLNHKEMGIFKKNFLVKGIIISLITLILCLPIVLEIINSYLFLILEYLHIIPAWETIAPNPGLYEVFDLNKFINYFSIIFILLLPLSSFYFMKPIKRDKTFYLILTMVLLLLLVLFSSYIGANIPPYRFVMYLSMFISLFCISGLLWLKQKNNKFIFILLVLLVSILFLQNISIKRGWSGFIEIDKQSIEYINQNFNENIKVTYGSPYYTQFKNAEWDPIFPLMLFDSNNNNSILKLLLDRYGDNKNVLLIISFDGSRLLKKTNPSFFGFMKDYEIYNKGGVFIYKVNTSK